ncbi:MAG: hypothetical protein MUO24_04030, partial [Desulfobacterales bacterium]|nr:hypothetical protein [Desulfobacterales bacterium]
VSPQMADEGNAALRYLWARERIARLDDYGKLGADVKKEVTNLGLRYHLMTQYTSFVAVDTIIRNTGETVTVKQPLPLPEGVSDYAVGERGVMKAKFAAPPSATMAMVDVSKGAGGYYAKEEKIAPAQIYLAGGKLPAGMTMDEAEKALTPVKGELAKLFQQWGLTKAVVLLTVEQGRVRDCQITSYQGKGYKKDALKKVLQKITFSPAVKGTVELEIEYL